MQNESIHIKKFENFSDLGIIEMPSFCIIVGANGIKKSNLISIIDFLQESLKSNVNTAMSKIGETDNSQKDQLLRIDGSIEIEVKYLKNINRLITYYFKVKERDKKAFIAEEQFKCGNNGLYPDLTESDYFTFTWNKEGKLIDNFRVKGNIDEPNPPPKDRVNSSIPAIKNSTLLEREPIISELVEFINNLNVSDLQIRIEPNNQQVRSYCPKG